MKYTVTITRTFTTATRTTATRTTATRFDMEAISVKAAHDSTFVRAAIYAAQQVQKDADAAAIADAIAADADAAPAITYSARIYPTFTADAAALMDGAYMVAKNAVKRSMESGLSATVTRAHAAPKTPGTAKEVAANRRNHDRASATRENFNSKLFLALCRRDESDADAADLVQTAALALLENADAPIEDAYSAAYRAVNKSMRDAVKAVSLDAIIETPEGERNVTRALYAIMGNRADAIADLEEWTEEERNHADAIAAAAAKITDRQRDIWRRKGKGQSNRQIADALHLSCGTVGFHLAKIRAAVAPDLLPIIAERNPDLYIEALHVVEADRAAAKKAK